MKGYYETDPYTARGTGMTAEQISKEAKADKSKLPRSRKAKPISEDRREVLRRMGLNCPTCHRPIE